MPSPDNQPLCDNLIHNIITLRKQYGLTKKAMAKLLGLSLYSLNKLESGIMPPHLDVEMVFRAQACFSIPIRDLFGRRL